MVVHFLPLNYKSSGKQTHKLCSSIVLQIIHTFKKDWLPVSGYWWWKKQRKYWNEGIFFFHNLYSEICQDIKLFFQKLNLTNNSFPQGVISQI